jgi:hypothetical protein
MRSRTKGPFTAPGIIRCAGDKESRFFLGIVQFAEVSCTFTEYLGLFGVSNVQNLCNGAANALQVWLPTMEQTTAWNDFQRPLTTTGN